MTFWMVSEGLSWPGGLIEGRFNMLRLPAAQEDIASHLRHGLKVEDGERSCVETWANDGHADYPGPGGITVRIFKVSDPLVLERWQFDETHLFKLQSEPPVYSAVVQNLADVSVEAAHLARTY